MSGGGIILGTIISLLIWFAGIILTTSGVIALKTVIFLSLALAGLLLFLILISSIKAKRDKRSWDICYKI